MQTRIEITNPVQIEALQKCRQKVVTLTGFYYVYFTYSAAENPDKLIDGKTEELYIGDNFAKAKEIFEAFVPHVKYPCILRMCEVSITFAKPNKSAKKYALERFALGKLLRRRDFGNTTPQKFLHLAKIDEVFPL